MLFVENICQYIGYVLELTSNSQQVLLHYPHKAPDYVTIH